MRDAILSDIECRPGVIHRVTRRDRRIINLRESARSERDGCDLIRPENLATDTGELANSSECDGEIIVEIRHIPDSRVKRGGVGSTRSANSASIRVGDHLDLERDLRDAVLIEQGGKLGEIGNLIKPENMSGATLLNTDRRSQNASSRVIRALRQGDGGSARTCPPVKPVGQTESKTSTTRA